MVPKPLCYTYDCYTVPQSICSCLAGEIGNAFGGWAFRDGYALHTRKVLEPRSYPRNEGAFLGLCSRFSEVVSCSSLHAIDLPYERPGSKALSSSRRLMGIYITRSVCGTLSYPFPMLPWVRAVTCLELVIIISEPLYSGLAIA